MTETLYGVYDLIYPSPVTLKEISSIVAVVELCREEICEHLDSKRLHELDLKKNLRLRNVIPNLPSVVYNSLEEYVQIFRKSIVEWLMYHKQKVFTGDLGESNDILNRFHDFTWDWNGTIHYTRTAKRMISCNHLDSVEKFKIACLYCFEEDINRIWPIVSTRIDLNEIEFDNFPELYFWVCYLRSELHKVPNAQNESIEEVMLRKCASNYHSSAEMYFWNHLSSDHRQSQININNFDIYKTSFSRFILPKLNKQVLGKVLAKKGTALIWFLLSFDLGPVVLHYVLPTWMYIRNKLDPSNFNFLIKKILISEVTSYERLHSGDKSYLFCEIWKSAPRHLKRGVLDNVVFGDPLYHIRYKGVFDCRGMKCLITVLQDATYEERNSFWCIYWCNLVYGAPVEDVIELMKWCFQTEDEIILFKENIMSRYENINEWCVRLLRKNLFEQLNDFLAVCCPNEQKIRELKQRLLMSNDLRENFTFEGKIFRNKLLKEFIEDAFQSAANLKVEFEKKMIIIVSYPYLLKDVYVADAARRSDRRFSSDMNW